MKGISNIIEIVLIIVITSSVIALIYQWSYASTSEVQKELEKDVVQNEGCLKIESIDTVNKKIVIRNCGENSLSSFQVYLDSKPFASYSGKLDSGSITQINYTQDISSGDHDIKIYSDYAESPKITFSKVGGVNIININAMVWLTFSLQVTFSKIIASAGDVMWLRFNEANGTRAYDSSGNGNDGTFYGETFNDGISYSGSTSTDLHTDSGYFDSAIKFDGVNDRINVTDSDALEPPNITIELWIYPTTYPGIVALVTKRIAGGTGYFLFRHTTGNQIVFDWGGSSSPNRWSTGYNPPLNTWTHLAVTRNSTHRVFYVNGTLYLSTTDTGTPSNIASTANLTIGYDSSANQYPFNGTIDEVRIYNRSLSQAEIQADMDSTLPITRPVASWSFEEPSGATYVKATHIWIKGMYGSALSFDSVNDYVDVSNDASLNFNGPFSIAAWVYVRNGGPPFKTIVRKSNSTYTNYVFDINSTNGIRFFIYDTSGNIKGITIGTATISFNTWTYLAGTYDGSLFKVYINGTQDPKTFTWSGSINQTTGSLRVGSYMNTNYFNGTIDEVKVWNKALSSTEITNEMYNG
ncbi:hypothetical protein A3K64_00865 [Candidatus Micrarchaeota archaeon RBG_16_36_9]|nr:MAG: hypothetical protein A3K64_00865 [Candidatus Micrarchaeota archaeon RBG_16_36_9]